MTPDQIRSERDRALARIRSRRDLTPEAQRIAVARAQKTAEDQMAAALQHDTEAYHRQRAFLERKLFGGDDATGYNALSARDAREKAAKLTDPQEAFAAFQRAQRAGDVDLVKAIASHAADQSQVKILGDAWRPVVTAYAESAPAKRDTYEELASMRQPNTAGDWSYCLDAPSELGRLTAEQVVRTADYEVYGSGPEAA